ncbi:MAG: HNH endonuclease [Melioribacteraceae bacterium]|nr:HNH endonuclease [Melioribacteraceae bacterium]MCF8356214.1 HNH endonuclease [Melioribacteraceae bacterium]MCF8396475.1 HNH endonuclease [Melioribacteraceae bacterium]MCF8420628.1 HNH endonuclease [Melioribacteraceae bacterium]
MNKRKTIPQQNKVRSILQQEINSCCPFCENNDVGHFEIHHIDENPSNNDINNLILLCPICHSKITKGDIPQSEVRKKKLKIYSSTPEKKPTQIFYINSNRAPSIMGNNNKVTIKNVKSTKAKKSKYPEGCIGYENLKANYVSYLITRYHECKEYEVGKAQMNYAMFSSHLKKQFKIGKTRTIYNVPVERFDELAAYIQSRILKTKLGNILNSRNQKIFSSFQEYKKDQSGNYT